MHFKEQLELVKNGLEDVQLDLQRQLEDLPKGSLHVYQKGGKNYYAQRFAKEGNRKKEKRVAITDDPDTVLALVRKKYICDALKRIDSDISGLDKMLNKYVVVDEESVMASFCEKYPELREGIYYGLGNPELWAGDYAQPDNFYVDDLKSISSQGEKIRSGGEMYISSRLDHFGIPYRYEAPLDIPDLIYHPDFTIMRPRDREIIYWEHFGKVNDYDYVRNSITKVRDYIEYGIKPWDNLIITYNNEKGGFNGKMIDAMIECWLL